MGVGGFLGSGIACLRVRKPRMGACVQVSERSRTARHSSLVERVVAGTITVTASSPGLGSSSVDIVVKAQDTTAADFNAKWCIQQPKW